MKSVFLFCALPWNILIVIYFVRNTHPTPDLHIQFTRAQNPRKRRKMMSLTGKNSMRMVKNSGENRFNRG
jgi:hypothetical protein